MKKNTIISLAAAVLVASSPLSAPAQDVPVMQKTKYHFPLPAEAEGLANCQCGIFTFIGNKTYLCNGVELSSFGDDITAIAFNPSAYNYIVISDKKGVPAAALFSNTRLNRALHKFNSKKDGTPLAATFSSDGRRLLVSVPDKIIEYNAIDYTATDTIPTGMSATRIVLSDNLNYLAMTDGSTVKVLNFETKNPRFDRKIDGVVTDIGFNPDCSRFAILTDDGSLQTYNTRTYTIAEALDDLDGGLAFDYNFDGKYVAVVTSPHTTEVINMLNPSDRETFKSGLGQIRNTLFVPDAVGNHLLVYTDGASISVERMLRLSPYYGKLIAESANERLNDWLRMMPGETMEQYNARVNDESRRAMLSQFERDAATMYAGDLVSMSTVSLGSYNPETEALQVQFSNMPSILLTVPESSLSAFDDPGSLEFRNAVYGVLPDDSFELIYTEVFNPANGCTYVYDNLERATLNFMEAEDNTISLDVIRQQQMEDVRLQEIKEQVVADAKHENLISEHTSISVDSRVVPDYDADGNRILNYNVKFTYEVDPEYTLVEDFGPGKYKIEESGAASSMARVMKQALEGDLAQYVRQGKKVRVVLTGMADAMPINRPLKYDGCYGEYTGEPVMENGQLSNVTVSRKEGLATNPQLAFVRALGVKDFIENDINGFTDMNRDYNYVIDVSQDKGSQYRRITAEFVFVDAF